MENKYFLLIFYLISQNYNETLMIAVEVHFPLATMIMPTFDFERHFSS